MASINGKKVKQSLLKKGFLKAPGDHNYFEFHHEGKFLTRTHTSHNDQEVNDYLISKMSKQSRMSPAFFKEFVRCTKSQEDYVAELKKVGVIADN